MAQKKWTPKRAKTAFFVFLKSSSFPRKRAKTVVSTWESRQQTGRKAIKFTLSCTGTPREHRRKSANPPENCKKSGLSIRAVDLPSHSDLLRRPLPRISLALTQFSWVLQAFFPLKRGVHGVINLGVVKTLWHSNSLSSSIFSTVGSFGWLE